LENPIVIAATNSRKHPALEFRLHEAKGVTRNFTSSSERSALAAGPMNHRLSVMP
jgi:hypothetical protein